MNPAAQAIQPSATLAISSRARELTASGIEVLNFSAGEPDFDTPEPIKEAAIRALRDGQTKYVAAAGLPALCRAVAEKLQRDNAVPVEPDQVVISNGAKHSLSLILQTLCQAGDEVLIPSPFWLSYPEMVRMAGAVPVFVRGESSRDYKITPAQLRAAATSRTRAMIFNSPSNPIGIVYDRAEIEALGAAALDLGLTVISDEIYERMVYDDAEHVSMASLSPEMFEKTITVNGFSKAYAMTGWRLGYAAGPRTFMKRLCAVQSHCASAPNTFAQYGALAAFGEAESFVQTMVAAFDARRARLYAGLCALSGIECVKPSGAFYVLPSVAATGMDGASFAKRLLDEAHMAVVPGNAFDADANIRLSYACSIDQIDAGVEALRQFLSP